MHDAKNTGGLMEGLRLLKHLVAETDATTALTAAEHKACSCLDTFSSIQTFSFPFCSQFVPLLPKNDAHEAF